MSNFLQSFIVSCALLSAAPAFANLKYETSSIGGNFTVANAEVQSIWLSHARYIRNILVQAEGIRTDSTIEVMVNGEVKGTIYAPGRDPSYVVTIGETASSIQFRHRTGGAMRIINVTATLSTWAGQPPRQHPGGLRGSASSLKDLANRAILAVESIKRYSTLEEERVYLLPIKKKAGQVLVMAEARGELSRKTIASVIALQEQIDFATDYIHLMMEQEGLFDEAVELLSIREQIEAILD
ncbi:MAG: hypothetical protein AAGB31_16715 [Bdellovibrio sp.]